MLYSEKFDLKLMQLVKENPVLYDYNCPNYMDFNARTVVWQKISDELKKPAADCKTRWVHIRDAYRRLLRLSQKRGQHREYKYENSMSFMRQYFKDVNFVGDPCDDAVNYECDFATESEHSAEPLKKKRKMKKIRKREFVDVHEFETVSFNDASEFDTSDSIDAFLLSIGATLKTFSPYHLNIAKTKIFSIVQEHDLQQIVQQQEEESNVASTQIIMEQLK
ncbi:uncharacterized protein LOC119837586 [Zerene cesonia]|uniref:uncharacterized protein LOC119837586 n=1 Tax=Zerene cesonia TaxID=33412 RepID=UPI0018E55061|nr:uncharacterized protein LOC119837586 [Zerene cesonia]